MASYYGTPPTTRRNIPSSNLLSAPSQNYRRNSTGNVDSSRLNESEDDKEEAPLTLLEQTALFRKKRSKKWREQQKNRLERTNELLGRFEAGGYVKALNEKLVQKRRMSELVEFQQKREPRQLEIFVQLCVSKNSERSSESSTSSTLNLGGHNDATITTYDLILTASRGLFLHNRMNEHTEIMELCCVKIMVFPEQEKSDTKRSSAYLNITKNGRCHWDHDFVIKGLTMDDYLRKYISIKLFGKNNAGKVCMGQYMLAGAKAQIKEGRRLYRPAKSQEKKLLSEAVAKLGVCLSSTLVLYLDEDHAENEKIDKKKRILRKGAVKSGRSESVPSNQESGNSLNQKFANLSFNS